MPTKTPKQTNIQLLLAMLAAANAITLDDGPYLDSWQLNESTGKPDNILLTITTTDTVGDVTESFTEQAVADGRWADDGKFVLANTNDDKAVLHFFSVTRLTQPELAKPTIVVDLDCGAIHNVRSSVPARVIFLDDDTEGGDEENIQEVNGSEKYVSDWVTTEDLDDGVDTAFVADVIKQIDGAMGGEPIKDFTGMTQIAILNSFGYHLEQFGTQFKMSIKDDPEAFTITGENSDELIAEAYQFLKDEVDPDIGYIFP